MRKVVVFMMVSLDGYFEGPNHDLSWHNVDGEFNKFATANLDKADVLLFGRRTYELMANFWPTYTPKEGDKDDAAVAEKMNMLPKIVFSRTLKSVQWSKEWDNATLIRDNIAEEITKLKQQQGKELMVLGSSNLCVSLLDLGLIDEVGLMINPVVIGDGTPLFDGARNKFRFKLLRTKTFKSGNILAYYKPLSK